MESTRAHVVTVHGSPMPAGCVARHATASMRPRPLTLLVVLASCASVLATVPIAAAKGPEARALERALKLLPAPVTVPIRLIEPELAPDADAIRRLDAFLVRERDGTIRQVMYLNRRSSVVENALGGKDIDVAILAAVIHHELQHLAGRTETEARRAEHDFFQRLVFAGHVPLDAGLAYLSDLEQDHRLREAR